MQCVVTPLEGGRRQDSPHTQLPAACGRGDFTAHGPLRGGGASENLFPCLDSLLFLSGTVCCLLMPLFVMNIY